MIERTTVVPVDPAELWDVLTDADRVEAWFGGTVHWDLEPGAPLDVVEVDGNRRSGVVEVVDPERTLRFRWWPTANPEEVSEVTYEMEPFDDGTMLRIIERPVAASAAQFATETACAAGLWGRRLGRLGAAWWAVAA